jgi:hypothetical protein
VNEAWLNPQNLGSFVVNILAVCGGFLVGYILMYYGLPWLLKMATARLIQVPRWLRQILSLLAGVIVAWLVSLLVFGTGGSGWWPGGGGGSGNGGLGTGKEGGGPTTRDTAPSKGTGSTNGGRPPEVEDTLRVEVLNYAGEQRILDTRLYRIAGEKELKTMQEIEELVSRRTRDGEPGRLKRLEIVIYLNSPDKDTQHVRDLDNLAKSKGLTTVLTQPPTKSP